MDMVKLQSNFPGKQAQRSAVSRFSPARVKAGGSGVQGQLRQDSKGLPKAT